MNGFFRHFALWFVIILILAAAYDSLQGGAGAQNLPFSEFLTAVDGNQVADVTIRGRNIDGHYSDGNAFSTYSPEYPGLVEKLRAQNVRIQAAPTDNSAGSFFGIILNWFPILLLVALWIFFMRQMQGGKGGGAMGFGKSRAKLLTEKNGKVTFADVAGIDEAQEELEEIVEFLKEPSKFQKLGGKIPKGVLLVGSPGTGKTLLARAIAGEAGVPFFTISGSDFVEMFVGVGASRVRDMFEQARKSAPCIVFIDEIDAVGRHRGAGMGGGNDEREQTLNQMLVEMDGFEAHEGVIIIAATNRPDVLDPALLRPGRFDRQITVSNPDIKGREKILAIHMKNVPLAPDVDANVIARGTPGFSGADLANLVNEAALLAARRNQKFVTMRELEDAKDKVMMGVERKSMVMSDEEKSLTAYHEAGHALVSIHLPACDPIHKATIIPRGRALGMVMSLPERDKLSVTREKLKADLAMSMGGRVAEELIFGYEKVTSGASSDIQHATSVARAMVEKWGMSDKIGAVFHGGDDNASYFSRKNTVSEATANIIDAEVKSFVENGHNLARKILEENKDDLHKLAKALLEYETLSGEEITAILAGKTIRNNDDKPKKGGTPSAVPSSRAKKPRSKAEKPVGEPATGSAMDVSPENA